MRLRTEPTKLPISSIIIPESRASWRPSGRCSTEALADLILQVDTVGWVDAVVVRPLQANEYELLDGERRLAVERREGRAEVDAVIVHVGEDQAEAISLLANLPEAGLPPIHFARLTERVRASGAEESGMLTNAEVGNLVRCDPSKVSVMRTISSGLPQSVLAAEGLSDEDLESVPATTLKRLAREAPQERTRFLRTVRDLKDEGAEVSAIREHLSEALKARSSKRGRPRKAYSVTNRADGRFKCEVRRGRLGRDEAQDLLVELSPVLSSLSGQAGFRFVAGMATRALLAVIRSHGNHMNERMLMWKRWLAVVVAIKMGGMFDGFLKSLSGRPDVTRLFERD